MKPPLRDLRNPATAHCLPRTADLAVIDELIGKLDRVEKRK